MLDIRKSLYLVARKFILRSQWAHWRSESRRARGAKCKRTARRVGKCLSAFRIDSRSLGYDDATKSSEREGRKKGAREEKKEEREREREISRIPRRKFLAVLSPWKFDVYIAKESRAVVFSEERMKRETREREREREREKERVRASNGEGTAAKLSRRW